MGCGIVDSFTRSCSLLDYTDDQCVIFRECMKLFRSLDQICISDLRGIGISMHKLSFKSSNVTCARTSEESLLKFLKKDVGSEKVIDEDHIEIVLEKSTKPTTIKRKLEVDKINCKKSNVSENSSTIEDEPSFLGLISLEEIKPAMSQWVVQCDVPSAEDSNLCVDFLIQLVQKHRLTFCYELLKFIFMQISLKQSHNRWKDFYRASTEIVQDLVKDKYSYPLKLPSFD
uniref:Uncharacterized protein n=1 Tax=Romanomermis culicivorax TaxID=13658 RepID=A0A915KDW3_ROMCU